VTSRAGTARLPIDRRAADAFAVRAGTSVRGTHVTLAGWLLAAVAIDLVVTRLVVRLAIFIPKGEPWATIAEWLGRLGAMTDVIVPIVGVLVLAALLLKAGRGLMTDRLLAVGVVVVAAAGLALLVAAPSPSIALAVDIVIALIAAGAMATWRPSPVVPRLAALGIVALAGSMAAAALVRALDVAAVLPPLGAWIAVAGQGAYIAGALLLGVAGLAGDHVRARSWPVARILFGVGLMVILILAGLRAPGHVGQIVIWSIGLTGIIPFVVLAVAVGMVAVGVPGVHRRAPAVAIGGSIILLSGYGLAASGLVLSGLLGLLVAREDEAAPMVRRS
jgi:hypothetical protein